MSGAVGAADFDPRLLAAALDPFPNRSEPPPGLAAYRAHYGLALPPAVRHEIGRVTVRGEDVVVQRIVPAAVRGSLLCVHGLFDHAALWRHQVHWALDRGLAVLLLDLPGHGLSTGARAHVESFEHYVDALEAAFAAAGPLPGPVLGLGQSTGCSVLMQAVLDAARTELALDDLVLLAPLVRPVGDRIGRPLLPVLAPVIGRLPRLAWGNTSDPAYNRFQREADPLQPRSLPVSWVRAMAAWSRSFETLPGSERSPLVIQGTDDRVVAWRGNLRRIGGCFRDPEIVLLEGARHNLMNELPRHRREIERLLDGRLARLR